METENKDAGSGAQSDEGTTAEFASALSGGNMSTLYKYVLRKNRVTIKEELELSVVDYLVSNGVFSLAHSDDIFAEKTRRDKAGRLLDLLEGRGSTAFDALVDCLKKTQRHLAEMLEKWAVEAAKIDEKTMNNFIYDDETMKDRAGLHLNIVTIHLEQRTGSSVQTVDLPLSLEYILGDEARYRLMCTRLQELRAFVFSCQPGSISLLLSFETQTDLSTFWLSYNDGSLQEKLASVLVTEDMRQRYPGAAFSLIMDVDIEQYISKVRQLAAHKPHHKEAATEIPQTASDGSDTADLLKNYAAAEEDLEDSLAKLVVTAPADSASDGFELESSSFRVESGVYFPDSTIVDRPVYELGDPGKRGLLVIISNSVFEHKLGLPKRRGSDIDIASFHAVFTNLGFCVEVMKNLRAAEMVTVLAKNAKKAGESGFSCFVSAILTHGNEHGVFGTDRGIPTKSLIENVARITELAGKPKIFFIQAARGTQLDHGIVDEKGGVDVKPKAADFLVCNSSAPGYFSLRNSETGSWFVNAIQQVFTEYGKKEDVLSLMTRVGHMVSKQQSFSSQPTMTRKMQMPVFESSLTKRLYLNFKWK